MILCYIGLYLKQCIFVIIYLFIKCSCGNLQGQGQKGGTGPLESDWLPQDKVKPLDKVTGNLFWNFNQASLELKIIQVFIVIRTYSKIQSNLFGIHILQSINNVTIDHVYFNIAKNQSVKLFLKLCPEVYNVRNV